MSVQQPKATRRDFLATSAMASAASVLPMRLAAAADQSSPSAMAGKKVSVFPDEIYAAPESWARRAFPKLIHFNKLDKGGHFAAWEQPALFTAEMRVAFEPLRKSLNG